MTSAAAAVEESKKVDGARIQLIRQASNAGQLYGSVSARDLAEALEAQGHKIAKNQIVLDKPIKAIGVQDVKIALHPEVSVTISVNVARSPEEAELQAQGKDVMAEMFEKDVAGFIEERDPSLEPGEIAPEPAAPAEEAAHEEASEESPAEEAAAEEAPADETSLPRRRVEEDESHRSRPGRSSLRGAKRRSNPGAALSPFKRLWIASPAARNDGPAQQVGISESSTPLVSRASNAETPLIAQAVPT